MHTALICRALFGSGLAGIAGMSWSFLVNDGAKPLHHETYAQLLDSSEQA